MSTIARLVADRAARCGHVRHPRRLLGGCRPLHRPVHDTMQVLRMIPTGAIAVLVAPALLRPETDPVLLGPRPSAAAWTRSILWTIVVGLMAVTGLEWWLG
jgi:hypothetical protein